MIELMPDAVRIFSARACAAPLEAASEIFTRETGIKVQIDVCARHCASQEAEQADAEAGAHDFLIEIAEYGVHDLAIGGAEYLLDDGEVRGIVQKGQRRLIAYRESAIIVPAGNPANVRSLKDLANGGVRVGISVKGGWRSSSCRRNIGCIEGPASACSPSRNRPTRHDA